MGSKPWTFRIRFLLHRSSFDYLRLIDPEHRFDLLSDRYQRRLRIRADADVSPACKLDTIVRFAGPFVWQLYSRRKRFQSDSDS